MRRHACGLALLGIALLVPATGPGAPGGQRPAEGPAAAGPTIARPGVPEVRRLAEPGWVEVRADVVAGDDEAPADARRRALVGARRAAVRAVAGVSVTASDLSYQSLRDGVSSDLVEALAVTRSEAVVVDERPGPDRVTPLDGGGYRMQVTLQARVVDRRRDGDPGFEVTVGFGNGAQARFRDGEPVTLTLSSTRDARLFVLDVTDDGVVVLLPNVHQPDTRVPAGGTLRFPGEALAARGVALNAQLPAGRKKSVETLVVVAVKGGADLPALRPAEGVFRAAESRGAVRLLGELLAPLAALPPSDWTVEQVPFEVWPR